MSSFPDRIRSLIPSLNKEDQTLGYKFLNIRDFESLQSLVTSAIIRKKRAMIRELTEKNLESRHHVVYDDPELVTLKAEIDNYIMLINYGTEET